MNGVIVLDKPQGFTSFDVVAVARRALHEKKVGHTGTLDPMATGVLPLLIGRAAKAADMLPDSSKEYIAAFRFCESTDTGDITGTVKGVSSCIPDKDALERVIPKFTGEIMQVPPMYSAVSVGGKRLYELARQNIEIEREPRKININELTLSEYNKDKGEGVLKVKCSKGTYIRTLIEDIAIEAGTLGVMTSLRRTFACGFSEADAISVDELRALADKPAEEVQKMLRPIETLFGEYRGVKLTEAQTNRFKNGGALDVNRLKIEAPAEDEMLKMYSNKGEFFAVGRHIKEKAEVRLFKLFVLE